MKKILFCTCLVVITASGFSQSRTKLYEADQFVWFGVDFSMVKLIGPEFNNPEHIIESYFEQWNSRAIAFIENDFKGKLAKTPFVYDTPMAIERSRKVSVNDILLPLSAKYSIGNDMIDDLVNKCNSPNNQTGIGVMLIAESLNRANNIGIYHVVFFDISSKQILKKEKFEFEGSGIGFLPYWDKPIFRTIIAIEKEYKRNYKEYMKRK